MLTVDPLAKMGFPALLQVLAYSSSFITIDLTDRHPFIPLELPQITKKQAARRLTD
jgi:hypothetical protein